MDVFVGSLPWQTTDQDLYRVFSQLAEVRRAVVVKDKMSGRSRGFGFVEIVDELEAGTVVERLNGADYEGRKLVVNVARQREDHLLDPKSDVAGVSLQLVETQTYTELDLPTAAEAGVSLFRYAPGLVLFRALADGKIALDSLRPREFEELVAELLFADGYTVTLGPGTKDGGVDVFASKNTEPIGLISAVWQAKRLKEGNKVGIAIIRELADTRVQFKASKGIVATTSFLTRGALERVQQDQYMLGKADRNDMLRWIARLADAGLPRSIRT